MVLRILDSNLILKDRIVRIDAKKAFIYLKRTEKSVNYKKHRLEPKNMPTNRTKRAFLQMQSDMERDMGIEDADESFLITYLFCIPAPYSLGNFIIEDSFMVPFFLNF